MRDDINTGGPAFPVIAENGLGHIADGMALRDYFAAKALPTLLDTCRLDTRDEGVSLVEHIAEMAYAVADAMLRARGA